MRARRGRTAAAALLAVLTAAGLSPCTPASESTCVPELSVDPDDPRPGRIVTVRTVHACPIDLAPGERLQVRIQPADRRIPLARAYVTPAADGAFEVSITVPPTMPRGPAIAHVPDWWEHAACPAGASCAAVSVRFDVRA